MKKEDFFNLPLEQLLWKTALGGTLVLPYTSPVSLQIAFWIYSFLAFSPQPDTVCNCVWKDSAETGAERALEGSNEHHGEADCAASSYRPYGKAFSPSWLIAESVAIPHEAQLLA